MYTPLTVKDVMHEITVIDQNATVTEAVERMEKMELASIMVRDGKRPVGIITQTDLLKKVLAKALNPTQTTVKEIMSSPLITIDSRALLKDASRVMAEKSIRQLPVLEEGRIVGTVTDRDIIEAMSKHFFIAYILIKVEPGRDKEIHSKINDFKEVSEVSLVYGAYDIVAKVEFEDFNEVDELVFKKIRVLPGVKETMTILASPRQRE